MTSEVAVIQKETQDLTQKAQGLIISNQTEYALASEFLKAVKGLQKKVTDTFDPICQASHKAWKEALSKKDLHLKPLQEAEQIVKQKSIAFITEQERIVKEQQEELRREAEAEEAKKKAALEARAKKAEESGKADKADELRAKAEEVRIEAPVIAPTFQKVNGQAIKEKWYAVVSDFSKLPDEYKLPNMPMLNKVAQATRGAIPVAGIEFRSEKVLSSVAA